MVWLQNEGDSQPEKPKPNRSIFLRGLDLDSGEPAEVRLDLDLDLQQPHWVWPGAPSGMPASELGALARENARCTRLSPGAEKQMLTLTEHALAALLFFPGLPVRITVKTGCLPLLDGSALPWREAFSSLAAMAALADKTQADSSRSINCLKPEPLQPLQYASPISLDWFWAEGFVRAQPAAEFSAVYEIERQGYHSRYVLENAAIAYHEVLPARTFIFENDYQALRQQGRLRGAEADSGLLLGGEPVGLLHPSQYRMPEEPARHKMLDLLGDLALNGLALPRLRLHLKNAGHAQHHRLLESLIHERDAIPALNANLG